MKFWKVLLVVLMLLANLAIVRPSLADAPKFVENPEYIEVTETLNNLENTKKTQAQTEGYNPEEIQKKIDELKFKKYALETGIDWGQCRNETGKTLAVYGPKPEFEDDDYEDEYTYDNGLYFLASGQTTKNKWDCDGVYLPSDATTTVSSEGKNQEVGGPVAIKVADGTQLVIKTNPNNANAVDFSIPTEKVFKADELNWFIPNVSQAVIDTRVANAPVAKEAKVSPLVGLSNPQKNTVEQSQAQPQPQREPQPNSTRPGYFKRT